MNLQTSLSRQLAGQSLTLDERAGLCCQLAKELEEAGNYEGARSAMNELWQRVGEQPNLEGLSQFTAAEVLLRAGALTAWIGSARLIEGAQETAKDLISRSLAAFEALNETEKAAEALTDLGYCYWREGASDEARVTLRQALARLGEIDSELRAVILLRSAIVELSATRYNDALRILTEAAPLFEASSNHALKGKFHVNLAIVLNNLSTGEGREDYRDRALVEYAAASFHFEQAGHTHYCARTENNLGFLLFSIERFEEAHQHLDRARRLFINLKDVNTAAQVDDTRARTLLAQGRNTEAEKTARTAVRTLEKGDEQSVLAEALRTHGTALARLGQFEQARATLGRAVRIAEHSGNLDGAGLATLLMIEELSQHLTTDEMQSIYERADELLAHSQHPGALQRLRQAARHVLAASRPQTEIAEPSAPSFVYAAAETAKLLRDAHCIAGTTHPVLLTGETGTGKNLLARLIHQWSGRVGEFVEINCATLDEMPIESRLFGHQRGSFPGATEDQPGAVREAAAGTLFLDNISELNAKDQTKLLRLIEHGEAHSIGAPQPEQVDVRIIAASDGQLQERLAHKLFREDLFYRLQSFHLELPPLRERTEDIPVLAKHFIGESFARYGERIRFTPEAISAIQQLPLKGNARELASLIERTVMTAPHGSEITRGAIETLALRQTSSGDMTNAWTGCQLDEEVRIYEGKIIRQALEATGGHITHAARLLGVTHQCLAYILQGRHKALLKARTPVQRRRRSIIKIGQKAKGKR